MVSRDGSRQLVSVHGSPLIGADDSFLGSVVVLRDIALEREVEDQRLRHQKLESVGLLAGGIAHDFNNILTGILGGISIARMRLTTGGDVDGVLEHAENACVRAQGLTTQLLTFARGGAPVKKVLRIEDSVRDSAELAVRGSLVALEFSCAPDVYLVEVDEGQIAQAINNLVLNSKQAMPNGGSITIAIANVTVARGDQLPLDPGPYVTVSVEDRGPGIAPEHLTKVFDPYFTTKEHGSGLGLASVHSIIERHGGHVAVSSTPGQGARFTIHLPAAACQTTSKAGSRPSLDSAGPRRLLILDDDASVRDVMQSVLEILGHRVVTTGRSTEAFEAFEQAQAAGDPFDAVFLDLTRPGDLGGAAVVARLREGDPAVKVVVMSGYSTSPLMADSRDLGLAGTLQKPFTVEMVRQVLASC